VALQQIRESFILLKKWPHADNYRQNAFQTAAEIFKHQETMTAPLVNYRRISAGAECRFFWGDEFAFPAFYLCWPTPGSDGFTCIVTVSPTVKLIKSSPNITRPGYFSFVLGRISSVG
jgi:hypothetical protein